MSDLKNFSNITKTLGQIIRPNELLYAMKIVAGSLKVDQYCLMLWDDEQKVLKNRLICCPSYKGEQAISFSLKMSEGISGKVYQSGEPVLIQKVSREVDFKLHKGCCCVQNSPLLSLPLCCNKIIGVWNIGKTGKNNFTKEDIEMFTLVAEHLAITVNRLRKLEHARSLSIKDNLMIKPKEISDQIIDKASVKNSHGRFLKKAAFFLVNHKRLIQFASLLALLFSAAYFYWQYETKLQTLTAEKIEDAKIITGFIQNEATLIMKSGMFLNLEDAFKKISATARKKGVNVNIYRPDGRKAFSDKQTSEYVLSLALEQKSNGVKDIANIPVSEIISHAQEVLKKDRPKVSESIFDDPENKQDEDYFDEALVNGESENTSHLTIIEKFIRIEREECGGMCHMGQNAVIKMVINKKEIENALASELEWGMAKVSSFIAGLLLLAWLYGKFDEIIRREREQEREKYLNDLANANSELSLKNKEISKYANKMEHLAQERSKQLIHADRMATLGVMSAGVAHEINNPITFIRANANTLKTFWDKYMKDIIEKIALNGGNNNKKLNFVLQEMPKIIDEIERGTGRIKKIVNSLSSFSRKEESSFVLNNISECIESAMKLCRLDATLKNKTDVKLNLPKDLPGVVLNKQEIEQVFVNLFVNAIHALEEIKDDRKPVLKITAAFMKDEVTINIYDNGCGMEKKTLDNIFNPFFTTKKVGKGTGLGLSICHGLIDKHRGTIKADSTPPAGTTFTITLPLDPRKKERRKNDVKMAGGMRKSDY